MSKVLLRTRDPIWVLAEDQRLREIIAAGGSLAGAADELNRSENAIANRARRLGISLKKKKPAVTPADRAEELAAT
jgi:hypothetical protein